MTRTDHVPYLSLPSDLSDLSPEEREVIVSYLAMYLSVLAPDKAAAIIAYAKEH